MAYRWQLSQLLLGAYRDINWGSSLHLNFATLPTTWPSSQRGRAKITGLFRHAVTSENTCTLPVNCAVENGNFVFARKHG